MKCTRIIAWTAPAAIVFTLGASAGLISVLSSNGGLHAVVGSLCADGALWASRMPPAETATALPAPAAEAADTSIVIGTPPGPPAETTPVTVVAAAPPPAPTPVDYARLNQDVRVVADTLERFNQKLLRMIAQARAEQLRAKAQAASESPLGPVGDVGAVGAPPIPVAPGGIEVTQ